MIFSPVLTKDFRYVKQRCLNCKSVLVEPALCLLCGGLCSASWKHCCRFDLVHEHQDLTSFFFFFWLGGGGGNVNVSNSYLSLRLDRFTLTG